MSMSIPIAITTHCICYHTRAHDETAYYVMSVDAFGAKFVIGLSLLEWRRASEAMRIDAHYVSPCDHFLRRFNPRLPDITIKHAAGESSVAIGVTNHKAIYKGILAPTQVSRIEFYQIAVAVIDTITKLQFCREIVPVSTTCKHKYRMWILNEISMMPVNRPQDMPTVSDLCENDEETVYYSLSDNEPAFVEVSQEQQWMIIDRPEDEQCEPDSPRPPACFEWDEISEAVMAIVVS